MSTGPEQSKFAESEGALAAIKDSANLVLTERNVCYAEKRTKRSSALLLCLVRFSALR